MQFSFFYNICSSFSLYFIFSYFTILTLIDYDLQILFETALFRQADHLPASTYTDHIL